MDDHIGKKFFFLLLTNENASKDDSYDIYIYHQVLFRL